MSIIASSKIISLDEAIILLNADYKPVIFWDSCSLLDIMRLPMPTRKQPIDRLTKIMQIKQAIVNGDILSLASKLSIKEFNDHINDIDSDLYFEARRISREYNAFVAFINTVNPSVTLPLVDLTSHKVELGLMDIIASIVDETYFIDEDSRFAGPASHKTINKTPPAHKKGEYKDCYIWTTATLARSLSDRRRIFYGFISSNVKDYANPKSVNLVPDLATEAATASLDYCANIDVMYGALKKVGVI
ncbi:hypothetical protein [Pedobacter miscanthi]|uniref:hypothetical protein n=1 Tax=Pedobacter miscanthi TaxID=2259170 RepID=UPI00292E5E38|nr:hypothetical protein [Pedobacter miscanthi]